MIETEATFAAAASLRRHFLRRMSVIAQFDLGRRILAKFAS